MPLSLQGPLMVLSGGMTGKSRSESNDGELNKICSNLWVHTEKLNESNIKCGERGSKTARKKD